jgi:hypothetical protein
MYRLCFLLAGYAASLFIGDQKVALSFSNEKGELAAQAQDSTFILNGKIKGQANGSIRLIYSDKNGKYVLDSSLVKEGRFQFRGDITEPTMVFLEGDVQLKTMADPNFTNFFLDPSIVTIELVYNDFKNAVITGSKTHNDYIELNNLIAPINKEWAPISKEFEKVAKIYREAVKARKDEKTIDSLKKITDEYREKYTPFANRIKKTELDFFLRHPQSFITAQRLPGHLMDISLDSLQFFYDNLGPVTQQTSAGKKFAKELEKLR